MTTNDKESSRIETWPADVARDDLATHSPEGSRTNSPLEAHQPERLVGGGLAWVRITRAVLVCPCGYEQPCSENHEGNPVQACGACGVVWWTPCAADCELPQGVRQSEATHAEMSETIWRAWARQIVEPVGDCSDGELRAEIDERLAYGDLAANEARMLVARSESTEQGWEQIEAAKHEAEAVTLTKDRAERAEDLAAIRERVVAEVPSGEVDRTMAYMEQAYDDIARLRVVVHEAPLLVRAIGLGVSSVATLEQAQTPPGPGSAITDPVELLAAIIDQDVADKVSQARARVALNAIVKHKGLQALATPEIERLRLEVALARDAAAANLRLLEHPTRSKEANPTSSFEVRVRALFASYSTDGRIEERDRRGMCNKLAALLAEPPTASGDGLKSAAEEALDKIATLCGCPSWDYPGQVVRDVAALVRCDLIEWTHRDLASGGDCWEATAHSVKMTVTTTTGADEFWDWEVWSEDEGHLAGGATTVEMGIDFDMGMDATEERTSDQQAAMVKAVDLAKARAIACAKALAAIALLGPTKEGDPLLNRDVSEIEPTPEALPAPETWPDMHKRQTKHGPYRPRDEADNRCRSDAASIHTKEKKIP